jgi:hypothetical protein
MAALKPGQRLLVHGAPIYPTTVVTIEAMGLGLVHVDFNDLGALRTVQPGETPCVLVQHARQRLEDRYSLADVIRELKARDPDLVVVVDDNYAAMRVARIGIQLGADVSAFSLFKLHGPEGVGCVVGREGLLDRIRKQNCSGGTQVQGVEAMEALRALTSVPVEMAVQAEVVEEVAARLNSGEVGGVAHAYVANAQSRVVLVELRRPCASQVLEKSALYGAACRPVGAESRYEILPLFYSVSRTFRQENPELADTTIRINPMRAGSDLVIGILAQAIRDSEGS